MEAVECGAASLAMVLAYFGKYIPLEQLRVACGVSRDGSKASNILKAARKYGLEAKGYRKEPEDLQKMSMPIIVHWDFSHFLVLEGFHKGKVYLNDPSTGRRIVTEAEFSQLYTGIAMSFTPTSTFQRDKQRPSLVAGLSKRLQGSERALTYIIKSNIFLYFKIFFNIPTTFTCIGIRPLMAFLLIRRKQ